MSKFIAPQKFISEEINITLIGAGGTGSYMFRELLELHQLLLKLGHQGLNVDVWDDGIVREANLGRQCFTEYELGTNKAVALVSHEHSLNHCLNWTAHGERFVWGMTSTEDIDILITAVDLPQTRYEIGSQSTNQKGISTLWLDLGNSDYQGQIILGELGCHEDKILSNCFDMWGEFYNQPDFVNVKSCSLEDALLRQHFGVNKTSARCGGQMLINLLTRGEISYNGVYFNVKEQIQDPIAIGMNPMATA